MDRPPEVENIAVPVQKLRTGLAVVLSVINTEYLKTWLQEAARGTYPDNEKWKKLVLITQVLFRDGYITEAMTRTMMVLIPMGGGR